MQPGHGHAGARCGLPRRRGDPPVARRAVDGAPRPGSGWGAPTTRPTCADRWSWPVPPDFETFNLDLIYGTVGESLADWESTVREALALEPPHVSAYGLTVEAGTPLAARPGPLPRRRRPGRQVRAGRRPARRGRPGQLRDLQLGPARSRVPAQPAVLVAGRLPRLRVRRALAPRRPPVVERPHPRALHRPRVDAGHQRRLRARSSTPRPAAWRGSSYSCGPEPACRRTPSTHRRASRAGGGAGRSSRAHPGRPPRGQRGRAPPALTRLRPSPVWVRRRAAAPDALVACRQPGA